MPVSSGTSQHQWLQQAELDVADAFLDQLDETPAKDSTAPVMTAEKQSKSSKKRKHNQPWFQFPEQKKQHLDMSEASSDHSSNEPLGESSGTTSSDSDLDLRHSKRYKSSKKYKLKSGMFAKHGSTIKKPQLLSHNHLDPHFVNQMPKFQDIS